VTTENTYLHAYIEEQTLAEQMIPAVGALYRDRGVIITVFGRKLMNASTIDIIKAHRLSLQVVGESVSVAETSRLLRQLLDILPGSSRIDIGKLAFAARKSGLVSTEDDAKLREFLVSKTEHLKDESSLLNEPRDIVLYGFGRIGRILARLLIERTTSANPVRLRAIVVRGGRDGDLQKRASSSKLSMPTNQKISTTPNTV